MNGSPRDRLLERAPITLIGSVLARLVTARADGAFTDHRVGSSSAQIAWEPQRYRLGERATFRKVVEQGLDVARSDAARSRDPRAEQRVRSFVERWAVRTREANQRRFIP